MCGIHILFMVFPDRTYTCLREFLSESFPVHTTIFRSARLLIFYFSCPNVYPTFVNFPWVIRSTRLSEPMNNSNLKLASNKLYHFKSTVLQQMKTLKNLWVLKVFMNSRYSCVKVYVIFSYIPHRPARPQKNVSTHLSHPSI